jgi:hypothetical protein
LAFSYWFDKPRFLIEGKLATMFIIPCSWGSQPGGYLPVSWSIIKNSAVEVSDERAIDAFTLGLRRGDLVEEMGRIKPKTVSDLMDIANRFAYAEDVCNNKRRRSPEDDRGNRYSGQRRRSRNYNNYGSHSQVAAGYKDNNYQGDDRRNSGYRSYGREDFSNSKRFQPREPREYNRDQMIC